MEYLSHFLTKFDKIDSVERAIKYIFKKQAKKVVCLYNLLCWHTVKIEKLKK